MKAQSPQEVMMMAAVKGQKQKYLTLDQITINPDLARRLPWPLAFKYHAIPLARENGHVTVVMADPNDDEGRAAVASALRAEIYPVTGNPSTIDRLLKDIWPEAPDSMLELLMCPQTEPVVADYADYLAGLLHARLSALNPEAVNPLDNLDEFSGHDLVILNEPDQSLLQRVFSSPAGCKAALRSPTSVLIPRQPTWPLKKILMVTRGQACVDNPAIEWLVRLAEPSGAEVTVLALVLNISTIYQQALTQMPRGVSDWLMSDTPLGAQLRQIATRLDAWQIKGRLHFRQGPPAQQIRQEAGQEAYDLIVIAADSTNWWERRLFGNLVDDLLHWADKPVLVAKQDTQVGV
jgi:nucleotide-binding universal stress UspA family protein